MRPIGFATLLACAVLSACTSPPTSDAPEATASKAPASTTASPAAGASPSPSPSPAESSPAAAAPPSPPATFRPGVVVYFDGVEQSYNAEAKATSYVNPNDGQHTLKIETTLPGAGYEGLTLTLIRDKATLAPGFTAGQVDRTSILVRHSITPQQYVGPGAESLTLTSTTGRLTGVAAGQVKPIAGAPKTQPFVRVEFDVEMPAVTPAS